MQFSHLKSARWLCWFCCCKPFDSHFTELAVNEAVFAGMDISGHFSHGNLSAAIFTTRQSCQHFTTPLISHCRWFFHSLISIKIHEGAQVQLHWEVSMTWICQCLVWVGHWSMALSLHEHVLYQRKQRPFTLSLTCENAAKLLGISDYLFAFTELKMNWL